jgi:HK97 family phage portal protein
LRWFQRRLPAPVDHQAAFADYSRAIGEGRIGPRQIGFRSDEENPTFIQRVGRALSGLEQRTITSLPWNTGSGGISAPAGTPKVDTALALTAVYASISLIARTISGMPLHAFRDVDGKKVELDSLPSLFDQPSVQGDLYDWLHRCISSLALYGNAYGLITARDGFGYPTGIEWLAPEQVNVVDVALSGPGSFLNPIWYWRGRRIPGEDIVHIPWFTRPWKVQGLSPLGVAASSINTGNAAQRFAQDWHGNGGVPPGTFRNTMKTVPREEAEEISDRLVNRIRMHRPLVFGADWEYTGIEINPAEARFIETMKLTANNVAAIYGVPPDRVGGEKSSSMTYSTEEQDSIDFIQFTVLSYSRKLESVFFKLLPTRQYVRFDLDSLIRTDMKTRHEIYKLDRQIGLRNVQELRDLENLPPITGEDAKDANSYAPLVSTGLADDQPAPAAMAPARPPANGQRTNGNGHEYRQMDLADLTPMVVNRPPDVYVTVNIPEREFRGGDIFVQPSPPADVRVELPVTMHASEVTNTVNVPERSVEVHNNVQPANAPEVRVPVTVEAAKAPDVHIEAPVTVTTPEMRGGDVNIAPAQVTVQMPKPEPPPDVEVLDGAGKVVSRTRRVKK